MNIFIDALDRKVKFRDKLLHDFNINTRKSVRDWHARRRPIACGLTIHTGVGCPFQCKYCYIYSMGFPKKIDRYPLEPEEVVHAILSNPWFVPGRYGTFLALGSVTEPFHPKTLEYTLTLISLISKYLGNPTQLSTKVGVSDDTAELIRRYNRNISILYSVTTLKYRKVIEPYAPEVEERFGSMGLLNRYGIHVTLFVRPILPGVTDIENKDILGRSREHGINRVLYGSLRVNDAIYNELVKTGIRDLIRELEKRLPSKSLGSRQEYIHASDVKDRLVEEAREYGFKIYPSACSANIDAYNSSCYMCRFGPCGDLNKLPIVDEASVIEFIEYLGIKGKVALLDIDKSGIKLKLKSSGRDVKLFLEYVKTVSRRMIYVSR